MQISQELLHNVFVPFSHDPHRTIRAIRYPPYKFQPLGRIQGRLAKKHALNKAGDRGFHTNRHGQIIAQSRGSAIEQRPLVGEQ